MTHLVLHRSADGQPVYHETESLEEAARHLEELRNGGQGADARIFRMTEIPIEVKTYYKVELPVDAPADAAPAPAPAAPEAPVVAEAPAPVAAPVAEAPAPSSGQKPEPAGASANGGRFGLFGKA